MSQLCDITGPLKRLTSVMQDLLPDRSWVPELPMSIPMLNTAFQEPHRNLDRANLSVIYQFSLFWLHSCIVGTSRRRRD